MFSFSINSSKVLSSISLPVQSYVNVKLHFHMCVSMAAPYKVPSFTALIKAGVSITAPRAAFTNTAPFSLC